MKVKAIRFRALIPLAVFVAIIGLLWYLFLDTLVRRSVEAIGTELVGAKVELASADVRLTDGVVRLGGLRVTNPNSPMTNLIDAGEIVADIRVWALSEKKVFLDTVAVRDLRFGTPRETSGALDQPTATSSAIRQRLDDWSNQIAIPQFSLAGLGQAVNVAAIRPESLQTLAVARGIVSDADSVRGRWERQIASLDPRPSIDSARALVERLRGTTVSRLNPAAAVASVGTARTAVAGLTRLESRITSMDDSVRAEFDTLSVRLRTIQEAQARDLAWARGLLQIPSLNAPDLSPALFGELAIQKLRPILYWLGVAQQYIPPGLDPRRRPGPKRPRRAGQTVTFPAPGSLPAFTLGYGEASLALGGAGLAAGSYLGRITGLTSAPSLLGQPLRITAQRTAGATGPRDLSLTAVLDHVTPASRDSIAFAMSDVSLPSVSIPGLAAQLDLGRGRSELSLMRAGDSIAGRWLWRSTDVTWSRMNMQTGSAVADRVVSLVWESMSKLRDVEIELRLSGRATSPRIGVRSNIATAVAASLRQQLQGQVDEAEARVRAEVNRLVIEPVNNARATVTDFQTNVVRVLQGDLTDVQTVKAELEAELRRLTRLIP